MTFEEAVAHVRAAASGSVAAYAFVPLVRRGETAGGTLYVVNFDTEAGDDEEPILVDFLTGTFASGDGAADVFTADDVPEEALDLDYEPSTTYDVRLTEYTVEVALAVLRGATLDDALAAVAAAPRPGPNATPEALAADLLLAYGVPATLATPGGVLPATIVLLDADDPRLGGLVDSFGGVVIADVGGAPAPGAAGGDAPADAEVDPGVDASATLAPDGVLRTSDDDEVDDALKDVAEAAWVGVGRGAVLATVLAVRALPEWEGDPRSDVEGDLPADLADAWRALLEFATAAADFPPDGAGRRPKAVYQQLRRLAEKIDRLVARQIAGHGDLVAVVAAAVEREIADGTFTDDDLALPTREELASGV
jgi:hypothetical protein